MRRMPLPSLWLDPDLLMKSLKKPIRQLDDGVVVKQESTRGQSVYSRRAKSGHTPSSTTPSTSKSQKRALNNDLQHRCRLSAGCKRPTSGTLDAGDVLKAAHAEASDNISNGTVSSSYTAATPTPFDFQKELSRLRKEISEERSEHERTRSLLQTAREELQTASFFLERTDSVTHAHVVELTGDLNHHIFELSAQISDALALMKWLRETNKRLTGRVGSARLGLISRKVVGRDFFQLLPVGFREEDISRRLMFLELTIQSWLVTFSFNLLQRSRWSTDRTEERVLSRLYERLLSGETSQRAFAGRWRILTREVCKSVQLDKNELANEMLSGMHSILTACEFHFSRKRAAVFLSAFLGSITCIVRNVLEIDQATKEKISTVDIHAIVGEPGQRYPSVFLEAEANSCGEKKVKKKDKVLLSTGLGLTITRSSEADPEPKSLLRAKVVLYTAVKS